MRTLFHRMGADRLDNWLLGGAQLGMPYGITNTAGAPDDAALTELLECAVRYGCCGFDSAPVYGASQQRLAQFWSFESTIVSTKVSLASKMSFREQLESSLSQLDRDAADYVFLHDPQNANASKSLYLALQALTDIRHSGLARKVGVSLYGVDESELVRNSLDLDVVQLPLNPWNQQFLLTGELLRLKQAGIEVHARSLFLQGVLLVQGPPQNAEFLSVALAQWHERLSLVALTPMEACASFAADQPLVDRWVLGFLSAAQIEEFMGVEPRSYDWSACAIDDERVTNPSLW